MNAGIVSTIAALLFAAVALGATAQRATPSAEDLLGAALQRASRENKTVLVEFGASWCAPCRRLQAFLHAPETSKVLDAHLIVVPIVVWENHEKATLNTAGGEELMFRLGGGGSIPFFAFLDASGRTIATSRPPGQPPLGYPSTLATIDAFVALLRRVAPRLTAAEADIARTFLVKNMDAAGSIGGRIVDASGRGVARASVSLIDRAYVDGRWERVVAKRVDSGETGHYELTNVPPGDYLVRVDTALPTYFPASSTMAGAKPVTVAQGQSVMEIDVAAGAQTLVTVSGRITSANVPASLSVVLTNVDWESDTFGAQVAADGSFRVTGVPPGRYAVWVRRPHDWADRGNFAAAGNRIIDVASADVNDVAIALTSGGTLAGRIIADGFTLSPADRAGLRVAAVIVNREPGAPTRRSEAPADAAGTFRMERLFGQRVLRVEHLPDGVVLERVRIGTRDVTDAPLTFEESERIEDVTITISNRAAHLSGSVTTDGKPLFGGAVLVFPEDERRWTFPSRLLRAAAVSDDGAFVVENLIPGHYLAVALQVLPANWDAPETLRGLKSGATAIEVTPRAPRTITLAVVR